MYHGKTMGARRLAFAYLRCTIYDVLFINNVRISQIFWIINVCRDSFRAIIMMIAGCHDF